MRARFSRCCPGAPLNASGTVIGYAAKSTAAGTALGNRAVRWNSSGSISELGLLGTDANGLSNSYSYAINTSGAVTGAVEKFIGNNAVGYRAVRWMTATNTTVTELGNLGTDANGIAQDYSVAINTAGTVAGYGDKYSGGNFLGQRAIRWVRLVIPRRNWEFRNRRKRCGQQQGVRH